MTSHAKPETVILGAGRLARALLPAMVDARWPVTEIAARRLDAARDARRGLRGVRAGDDLARAAQRGRLVLLALPDRELSGLARRLAALGDWHGRTVLHHAGALGPELLAPLAERGAAVGVLHPLQCLGRRARTMGLLPGSHARIEGDARARSVARRLARAVGLVPIKLPGSLSRDQRVAYHTAASLVSNDCLALLDTGVELFGALGLEPRAAIAALEPLLRGTLAQAKRDGIGAALTGPAVRGDLDTLERHMRRLRRVSPAAEEAHRQLSVRLLEIARREGLEVPRGLARKLGGTPRKQRASSGRSRGTKV